MAIEDRIAIFDYIEVDSPQAAGKVDVQFEEQAEALLRFPETGRPGRVSGTRELVVQGTQYVIAYSVTSEVIRILRVLHGAQHWPADF
jgi:toxin ParE1/3/4